MFAAGWTPAPNGSWQCFSANKFPHPAEEPTRWLAWDPAQAATDDGPRAFAAGLNRVAKNSPVGTTVSAPFEPSMGRRYNLICVKY